MSYSSPKSKELRLYITAESLDITSLKHVIVILSVKNDDLNDFEYMTESIYKKVDVNSTNITWEAPFILSKWNGENMLLNFSVYNNPNDDIIDDEYEAVDSKSLELIGTATVSLHDIIIDSNQVEFNLLNPFKKHVETSLKIYSEIISNNKIHSLDLKILYDLPIGYIKSLITISIAPLYTDLYKNYYLVLLSVTKISLLNHMNVIFNLKHMNMMNKL